MKCVISWRRGVARARCRMPEKMRYTRSTPGDAARRCRDAFHDAQAHAFRRKHPVCRDYDAARQHAMSEVREKI